MPNPSITTEFTGSNTKKRKNVSPSSPQLYKQIKTIGLIQEKAKNIYFSEKIMVIELNASFTEEDNKVVQKILQNSKSGNNNYKFLENFLIIINFDLTILMHKLQIVYSSLQPLSPDILRKISAFGIYEIEFNEIINAELAGFTQDAKPSNNTNNATPPLVEKNKKRKRKPWSPTPQPYEQFPFKSASPIASIVHLIQNSYQRDDFIIIKLQENLDAYPALKIVFLQNFGAFINTTLLQNNEVLKFELINTYLIIKVPQRLNFTLNFTLFNLDAPYYLTKLVLETIEKNIVSSELLPEIKKCISTTSFTLAFASDFTQTTSFAKELEQKVKSKEEHTTEENTPEALRLVDSWLI